MPNPATIVIMPENGNYELASQQVQQNQQNNGIYVRNNANYTTTGLVSTDIVAPFVLVYVNPLTAMAVPVYNPGDPSYTGSIKLYPASNFGRGLKFRGSVSLKLTYSYDVYKNPANNYGEYIQIGINFDENQSVNRTLSFSYSQFESETISIVDGYSATEDIINSINITFDSTPNTTNTIQAAHNEIVIKKIEFEFEDFIGIDDSNIPFTPPSTPQPPLGTQCQLVLYPHLIPFAPGVVPGTVAGGGLFDFGDVVQITATPNTGYRFIGWATTCVTNSIISYDANFSYTIPSVLTMVLYALFEEYDSVISTLTITKQGNGAVTGAGEWDNVNQKYTVQNTEGSTVNLAAFPDDGYNFSGWYEEDGTTLYSSDSAIEYTFGDADDTLIAVFTKATYTVYVNVIGNGTDGTVTGAKTYNYDDTVTLVANTTGNGRFVEFQDTETGHIFSAPVNSQSFTHSFAMPSRDVHLNATFFMGVPAAISGSGEKTLQEGYNDTYSQNIAISGTNTDDYPIAVTFNNMGTPQLSWSNTDGRIFIAEGLKSGTYRATITASNAFNANPYVFNFTLYVTKSGGEEPTPPIAVPPEVVEVPEGIVPIRIPSVFMGAMEYKHIPLIELHSKRQMRDMRLFYAYELLGKNRGCLRLSRLHGSSIKIHYDRVIRLPRLATSQIDLPENMIALIQAHVALALALRHNPSAVERLREKVAQCSLWFARQQSAIDRDTFLDVQAGLNRFRQPGSFLIGW